MTDRCRIRTPYLRNIPDSRLASIGRNCSCAKGNLRLCGSSTQNHSERHSRKARFADKTGHARRARDLRIHDICPFQ
jgi:hypothetical protein